MITNFVPQIWSTLINKSLEKSLVYGSCTNSVFEGQIKSAGQILHISEIGDITVNPYVAGTTTLAYEELNDAGQNLTISESKSFSFKLDDVNKYQANAELLKPAVEKATYAIADTIDSFISGKYTDAGIISGLGTDAIPIALNKTIISQTIVSIARALDDAKVPRDERFLILPPWAIQDYVNANIAVSTNNTDLMANGFVTRYAGFDILMSQNVSKVGANYKILAGHKSAIAYAGQASEVEALRLEGSFSDAVRGLYLYGCKVINPDRLACLTAAETAD